jgi:hypothetical protein
MPAIDHGSNESACIIIESAAYAEHAVSGGVYREKAHNGLIAKFDALRAECWGASESLDITRNLEEIWTLGVSPLTQVATVASGLR